MEIKGALVKIKDTTFAIIEVDENTISNENKALEFVKKHSFFFPRVPIVLMSTRNNNNPVYYGKKEIVQLLTNIHPKQIPWKKYTIKKAK